MTGARDIVERLGWHHEHPVTGELVLRNHDGPEAANEIASLRANIAVKADWIEKTTNDMAVQDATLATLRKELENVRSEALEEAAVCVGQLFGLENHVCDAIRLLKGKS